MPDREPRAAGAESTAPMLTARRFLPLFLVQALGAFNDNVFKNAFIALLTFKLIDELALEMSLVTLTSIAAAIFILPFALFAPIAGQIADQIDKAKMMRAVKFIEILLMFAAAAAYHIQNLQFLYVLLFLMGAQSALFSPIKYGVLPQYLPADELVRGNGLIQAATFLAILLGTIAGFQLMKTDAGVLLVSAAVIGVAVAGFVASLYAPPAPPAAEETAHILPFYGLRALPQDDAARRGAIIFGALAAVLTVLVFLLIGPEDAMGEDRWLLALGGILFAAALYALWPSIGAAIDAAQERPVVWRTILAISWFWFTAASFITLLPALVKETIGGNEDVVTLLLATFSIGVAIGASLVSWLQQGRIQVGVAPVGALGIAVFSIDLYFALGLSSPPAADAPLISAGVFLSTFTGWRVLVDFIGLAICAGLYVTPLNAIYQHNAPPEAVGRVVAASNMIDSALMAISSVVIIALQAAGLAPPAVMALLGATGLATTLVVARWSPETRLGRAALSLFPAKAASGGR
ncbi:MAG: MFS transporter [Pseudomonadota bacterium]